MSFADLTSHAALLQSLAERGYAQPTPVQALMLAEGAAHRDLLVSAQTGSGKTVAFGLAMAQQLLEPPLAAASAPLALVIAPTRELALQVQEELAWLYACAGLRVRACVGGVDPRGEQRALAAGAHVVVGTPGRLCDHLDRKNLNLAKLRVVVLDEADEMLDMGFRAELERILKEVPAVRRTLLLSATLPPGIVQLASRYQKEALRLTANPARQAHQDIEYRALTISPRDREHGVVNTLRQLEPASALVFCATRDGVNHLQASLAERGFQAVAISGELTQPERLRALQALRDGRARVLVATDVAARGLDLPALDLVLHADLPRDSQVLQHRSGRTGRAGRKGVSVVLVPVRMRAVLERMFKDGGIRASWAKVASPEEIRKLDQERLAVAVGALCSQATEDDQDVARRLLAEHGAERLVGALVHEQRARLPAPEELAAPPAALPETAPGRIRRPPMADRPGRQPTSGVWFRLNVGRLANADPRWLVPLICRKGGVVKADIGKIAILPKETRFLISTSVAERFAQAIRRPDTKDASIHIEPLPPRAAQPASSSSARRGSTVAPLKKK
jgi:ATP-dependent RNA helicase DeaD